MRLPVCLLLGAAAVLDTVSAVPASLGAKGARKARGLTRPQPNTVVFDAERMSHTAELVSQGQYADELAELLKYAQPYLSKGPWTVTNKKMAVPDGSP